MLSRQALDRDCKKLSTESESKTSDSTSTETTVINTDSRHTFSATIGEEKQSRRGVHNLLKEHLPEKVLLDNSLSHPAEQKEFAVPVLPAICGRKQKKIERDVVVPSDSDEPVDREETEKFGHVEDSKNNKGRKRVNSDGGMEVQEDDSNRKEENVSYVLNIFLLIHFKFIVLFLYLQYLDRVAQFSFKAGLNEGLYKQ